MDVDFTGVEEQVNALLLHYLYLAFAVLVLILFMIFGIKKWFQRGKVKSPIGKQN